MEILTKPRKIQNGSTQGDRYRYSYKVKDGSVVEFFGSEEIKKYFDVHHYCKGGTIYYRKK